MFIPDDQVVIPVLIPRTEDPAVTGPSSLWVGVLALVAGWAIFRVAKPTIKKALDAPKTLSTARKRKRR